MPLFEYTKWDGSQQFLPQSADKVFDQLSEYLMQYGERVLRNMDELEEEMPEIVELIQKEGLIEKDLEGQWRVTPRGDPAHPGQGARRPVPVLPPRFARPPRHPGERRRDRPARGHAAVRLRRLAGQPEPARDDQECLHPPGRRRADPAQLGRLRRARDRVPDAVRDGRPDRHERVDGPVREVLHDQESRPGAPGDGPGPVPARLAPDDRLLYVRQPDERAAAHQLGAQAGQHVRQPDPPAIRPRSPGRPRAPALHQHPRGPAAGAERPDRASPR